MNEIKYEVVRDSKEDRPYIQLHGVDSDNPDYNFAIVELSLGILYGLLAKFENSTDISEQELEALKFSTNYIHSLSDRMAMHIANQMDNMDDINDLLNNTDKDEDE